ncbi:MAG: hypothetical protein A4E34_01014 [Methanoregula sp. PtaU1.Bin006]|nr:MAG: hypothetical protein A4E34_01014 [Methanoregula sp. PtaU1.Bin006]
MVFCLNGFSRLLFAFLSSGIAAYRSPMVLSANGPMNRRQAISVKVSLFARPALIFLQDRSSAMNSRTCAASTVVMVKS